MDFIFMLTRQDQTVLDALDVLAEIQPLGLRHIGFKDVGVDRPTLRALNRAIKAAGATSYMEVVSTSPEAALQSARVGAEIGIDRLLGGTSVAEILAILKDSAIAYYPFPGKPLGHPTKLGGTAELVEAQCKRFLEMGCAGVDLLAYRAVDSAPRIAELKAAGCDAFTIGSAAFDGSFSPRKGRLTSQLQDILAAC